MRWTTGIGIAVGGVGGAIAALMGAPHSPAPPVTRAPRGEPPVAAVSQPEAAPVVQATPGVETAPSASAEAAQAPASSARAASADTRVPEAPASASAAPAAPTIVMQPLEVPKTREALLKAELYCDQKKDFDECARAALALETGSTGPADPEQAKRFRRIALTHLVMQCESASAHACFVLAAKYRAGSELAKNDNSAAALEKRGAELCRLGSNAPECP